MDYSKTKIYKIWSTKGDKIYVGATTKEYLSERMTAHRHHYNKWKKQPTRHSKLMSYDLFDEYGVENCFIELLEAKECSSKDEQKKIEGSYIRSLDCVNRNIPDRTRKEYYEVNKEQFRERNKRWTEENKEHITQWKKDYKETYNIANKEYIYEKFICPCSGRYSRYHKLRHERSIKHQNYLNNLVINE